MRCVKRKLLLVIIALVLSVAMTTVAAPAGMSPSSAISFVREFYTTGRHSVSSSLPTAAELKVSPRLFSARLRDRFIAAAKHQAQWMARHPDEPSLDGGPPVIYKPPFVDGDIFIGSPDGSRRFAVTGATRRPQGGWLVQVRSKPEPDMSQWRILVVVVMEDRHLAIDDVLYQSNEDDSVIGSLSENLKYRKPD